MTTNTDKIFYRTGYKYQLHSYVHYQTAIKPHKDIVCGFIHLSISGMLSIAPGYAWDGPSGLTWDTKSAMRGSLVHDALYELLRNCLIIDTYREYADTLLRDICIEDGMWVWRANMWYEAVSGFAEFAADPENKKKIVQAP